MSLESSVRENLPVKTLGQAAQGGVHAQVHFNG